MTINEEVSLFSSYKWNRESIYDRHPSRVSLFVRRRLSFRKQKMATGSLGSIHALWQASVISLVLVFMQNHFTNFNFCVTSSVDETEIVIAFCGKKNPVTNFRGFTHPLQALAVYEYVITLRCEVDTVWRRPWNVSSVLFLSNRWLGMLAVSILAILPDRPEVSTI